MPPFLTDTSKVTTGHLALLMLRRSAPNGVRNMGFDQ